MTRFLIATLVGLCAVGCATKSCPMSGSGDAGRCAAMNAGKVRHVVLFKFKDAATPQQIKEIETAFANLPKQIPTITGFEWGTNISPEGLAQGYTHCFVLTFNNEADRDAYLPHPAHKAFGQSLGPILDKVCVVDYKLK